MGAFATWLAGFAKTAWIWLINYGIDFIQATFNELIDFIFTVMSIFPGCDGCGNSPHLPTTPTGQIFAMVIQTLNWIFPIQYMIAIVGYFVCGITAYIIIAPVARWLKLLT